MEISVIIPVKNGEKYLSTALDSVFNQTFKGEYEVILGIDPSEDKTNEIAKEYQAKHSNLIVENRRGLGVQTNRMDSVKIAKGKYLCFLDADDYYEPTFLEKMYAEITKGYDVINCGFKNLRKNKVKNDLFRKNIELNSPNACKSLLKDSYMRGFLWNKIFKKELFKQNLPTFKAKDAMFEDVMLVYYIFMSINKAKSLKESLYVYRSNELSATKKENKNRFLYHLKVFSFIRYLCDKNENPLYLKGFRKELLRSKLSLIYDAYSTRHALGHGVLKEFKIHKKEWKFLKNKKKMDYNPFQEFINESFKPL